MTLCLGGFTHNYYTGPQVVPNLLFFVLLVHINKREIAQVFHLNHIISATLLLIKRCFKKKKSRAAYLEEHTLLSGISKVQCCPFPKHRCQLLARIKFPVRTCCDDLCHLLLPGLNVQFQDCESRTTQVSMGAATRARTPPNLTRLIKLASSSFVTFSFSLSLMPTSLWLVTEPQQSLPGWGLAGIKQLNLWADYFRDSLPPVPIDYCHRVWGLSWPKRRPTTVRI